MRSDAIKRGNKTLSNTFIVRTRQYLAVRLFPLFKTPQHFDRHLKTFRSFLKGFAFVCLTGMSVLTASALPAGHYAAKSKLADGRWGKIEVLESGIQFISNATLRNLGFPDPSKVKVYGYGGRMLPERLDDSIPDDLPLIPSVQTSRGIIFFGLSNVEWNQDPTLFLSIATDSAHTQTNPAIS